MAGTYGWNVAHTEDFIENENEGEYIKMPMPYGTEEESEPEVPSENPCIRGCCFCCDTDDQPEFNRPDPPSGNTIEHEKDYFWCCNTGEIPVLAVKAGIDKDGGDIYVGRAIHEGELQPAKIVPNHGCAYIAYNGEEIRKDDYEILCRGQCNVIWQECQEGVVPAYAVAVGCTSDNEKLYIGRVFHDGTHTPGKIQPSHGSCYIPYGGEELCFTNYEVLILMK